LSIKRSNFNGLNYVNMLMDVIYEDVTDIYESIMDEDFESMNNTIDNLILLLKETKDIHQDETDRL
jgi:hypothetical protein